LHLTLLRRWRWRWLHLALLRWRRRRSLWRLFLLFLICLRRLSDHKRAIEWSGVGWSKHDRPQDRADQQPLFRFGHRRQSYDVKEKLQIQIPVGRKCPNWGTGFAPFQISTETHRATVKSFHRVYVCLNIPKGARQTLLIN
jgi:hypothetical protein